MAIRSKKILELSTLSTASNTDVIHIVDDPDGTPVNKHITVGNLLRNVKGANNIITGGTFTNSTANGTVLAGQMYYDSDYLYIATDDGEVKRLTLSSF